MRSTGLGSFTEAGLVDFWVCETEQVRHHVLVFVVWSHPLNLVDLKLLACRRARENHPIVRHNLKNSKILHLDEALMIREGPDAQLRATGQNLNRVDHAPAVLVITEDRLGGEARPNTEHQSLLKIRLSVDVREEAA